MRPIVRTAMQTLLDCGVSVIPIRPDGSKAALVPWHPYQHRRATPDEVQDWTQRFAHMDCGLAIVAGKASDNVEVLDFDDTLLVEPWRQVVEQVQPGLVASLVSVHTPRPGRTFWYRCATIAGNQKLAQDARKTTLIETRGQGGYALIPPSPGACHPTHRPYTIARGTLRAIPEISVDARELLHNSARLFQAIPPTPEPRRSVRPQGGPPTGDRPGDLFAAAVSWGEILEPYGWTCVGTRGPVQLWKRPGKARGCSAISGGAQHDLLYVFSTNGDPFESEQSYSKFAAYSWLTHGGDFSQTSRALSLMGYRRSRVTAAR